MGDRGQGGVLYREHVSPLGVIFVGRVGVYTDHRNLTCISEPEAYISSVPKTAAQRLESWKIVLAQYDYRIMYISGEYNCWADPLPRWINVPAVAVRAIAVFASSVPDETLPSEDTMRQVQLQQQVGLDAMVSGASSFTTPANRAMKDYEDLFCVGLDSRDVLWIFRNKRRKCRRGSWCTLT